MSEGTGLHTVLHFDQLFSSFLFLFFDFVCNGLHLLQREVSLMKGEDDTYVFA